MQIAVTGATGFLGRYIVQRLLEQKHRLRCWHRPASDRTGMPSGDPVEWVPGGLAEARAADELVAGCDAVVHAALDRPGPGFMGNEGDLVEFVQRNVLGTIALMEAARRSGVGRFVFIGTCAVHDKILDDRPLDETHPLWPKSHYGAYKAAIEKFVHSYGYGENWNVCSLRPCGIYGLAHPPQRSKWFDLVRRVVNGEPVECTRGGKEVHAADVAQAVDLLLSSAGTAGEAYSCCDRYVSEFEVATLARRISGSRSEIRGGPTQPRHQIVTEKLKSLGMQFGGEPLLERTVEELVEAARN